MRALNVGSGLSDWKEPRLHVKRSDANQPEPLLLLPTPRADAAIRPQHSCPEVPEQP